MLALRAARLFDGTRETLVERPLVTIDEGRIVSIESGAVQPPAGAEVVDLGDVTIMPGLIDVHVHLGFDAGDDPVARMIADDDGALLLRMRLAARVALKAGITTVRDLGDRNFLGITLRDWFRSGAEQGPEVLAAGPPITVTGGHCYFMNGEADGEQGVRVAVRERVKRGVDVIKIMATGGHMTPGTNPLVPQYTVAELAAAVEEAHRLGRKLTAHGHGASGIARAVEARVDGIEHCSFQVENGIHADQALIDRIAAYRIAVAPTIGRPPGRPLPPVMEARREARNEVLQRMHRAGCFFVVGTDAGIRDVPHDSAPWAIRAFAEVGLSNVQALRTGTSNAAIACGIADRKGTLAPGTDADLLVVGGNPLQDLAALHDVRAVYRAGVPVE
jgi:imidazolonepropionase-like amidohydrolase